MGVRIFRGGELDEKFVGSVVVLGPKPTHMTGLVRGDLFVRERSLCEVTGMVTGMLLSEPTGKAVVKGMVAKDVKSSGGDIEVYGYVMGDVIVEGAGKVYVDPKALVRGQVRGNTVSSPPIGPAAPPPARPAAGPDAHRSN
jgi:hypothetical protein